MVASKEAAGQHGPRSMTPGFTILTGHQRPYPKSCARGCGEARQGGRGVSGGAPRVPEPPVLPISRGLSALGGSVGTLSSRRFVLVHLGAEPLMHS